MGKGKGKRGGRRGDWGEGKTGKENMGKGKMGGGEMGGKGETRGKGAP